MTLAEVDARIEELLGREDWWKLPPALYQELYDILFEMWILGLDLEAGRIEAMRRALGRPPAMHLGWNRLDPRITELVEAHAAEMVRNVDDGTKYYLRQLIKEGWHLGTSALVERIQRDLFGLPAAEAAKLPRERLLSIVNYETNRAMSGAAHLLRDQLGLKLKGWFVNNVSPCQICLDNQAQGWVPAEFLYEGVFGQILHPPAHPRTCRCLAMAKESEVRALGTAPIQWPMQRRPARLPRIPP